MTRGKFIDKDGRLRPGHPMLLVAAPTVVIRDRRASPVVGALRYRCVHL